MATKNTKSAKQNRPRRFAEARGSAPCRDGYKANFLWPHKEKSVEEAGYEFANARTEGYRKIVWGVLLERIKAQNNVLSDTTKETKERK